VSVSEWCFHFVFSGKLIQRYLAARDVGSHSPTVDRQARSAGAGSGNLRPSEYPAVDFILPRNIMSVSEWCFHFVFSGKLIRCYLAMRDVGSHSPTVDRQARSAGAGSGNLRPSESPAMKEIIGNSEERRGMVAF
jgi:hypothetical protein